LSPALLPLRAERRGLNFTLLYFIFLWPVTTSRETFPVGRLRCLRLGGLQGLSSRRSPQGAETL